MFFLFFIFLFSGCAMQKRSCPPIAATSQAEAILKEYSAGLKPLKATGNCTLSYTNEKGETFAQSFPVRIWFESNRKFCLYGDVMFDPRGIGFAVNGDDYWTYAKPFGTYVTGKVNTTSGDYFSNPSVLVDFLEPLGGNYSEIVLAEAKDDSILICREGPGCISKKIYIGRCGRTVKKIEYFNCAEKPALIVEADEYKNVTGENFSFPRKLIYRYSEGQKNDRHLMQIKLDSVQYWKQQPQQVKALFTPPDANSIKKETK